MGASEEPMALLDGSHMAYVPDAFMFSNERLHLISGFASDPTSRYTPVSGGADSVAGNSGTKLVTGTSTDFTGLGAYGSKLLLDGNWYTLDYVNSSVQLYTTTNLSTTFSGEPMDIAAVDLVPTNSYGPRYCYVAGSLVLASKYAVYRVWSGFSGMLPISRRYRGRDVVSFAGRPVLCGVYEGAAGGLDYYSSGVTNLLTQIRWPTKGDLTDWTSYGAGFLEIADDGSPIVAGANWGEDAFVFTVNGIHRLIETGMSAYNPIQARRLPVEGYMFPISNVVAGHKGLYWWTANRGMMRFDGQRVHHLHLALHDEIDHAAYEGPHMAYVPSLRAIVPAHDANHLGAGEGFYQVFFEDTDSFSEIDSNFAFCGIMPENDVYWAMESTTIPVAAGTKQLIREVDESSGTLDAEGNTLGYDVGWIVNADPHILKRCEGIRIFYEGSGTIANVYVTPVGGSNNTANVVLSSLTGTFGTAFIDPPSTLADPYPAWEVELYQVPGTIEIYGVQFLYTEAGTVGASD
jgi:hypothetical protein